MPTSIHQSNNPPIHPGAAVAARPRRVNPIIHQSINPPIHPVPGGGGPAGGPIPQAMARTAGFRLKTEMWAALQSARVEWKTPNATCACMWARIGAAIHTFEKEMGL